MRCPPAYARFRSAKGNGRSGDAIAGLHGGTVGTAASESGGPTLAARQHGGHARDQYYINSLAVT
jgi:hypothetical protein